MYKCLEKYTYMVLPFLPSASTVTVNGIAILCVIFCIWKFFFQTGFIDNPVAHAPVCIDVVVGCRIMYVSEC